MKTKLLTTFTPISYPAIYCNSTSGEIVLADSPTSGMVIHSPDSTSLYPLGKTFGDGVEWTSARAWKLRREPITITFNA